MASIRLKGVTLRYPIYTARGRGLKSTLISKLGGTLSSDANATWVTALDGLDLDLADGDRLGIIGHNGSGKTTLLRVLSGIYEPQEGVVAIEGDVSCFVDITLGMDADRTGWENIQLRGVFMGLPPKEIEALAPAIAAFSELGEYLDMPVRTLLGRHVHAARLRHHDGGATGYHHHDEMIGAGDAQFLDKAVARGDGPAGEDADPWPWRPIRTSSSAASATRRWMEKAAGKPSAPSTRSSPPTRPLRAARRWAFDGRRRSGRKRYI